jgi:hypothetical protein
LPHYPEHSAVSQEVEDLEFLFLAVVCHPGFVTIEKIALTQALKTFVFVGMMRCLFFQNLLDSLEKVDTALTIPSLTSVSRHNISVVVEPRYQTDVQFQVLLLSL